MRDEMRDDGDGQGRMGNLGGRGKLGLGDVVSKSCGSRRHIGVVGVSLLLNEGVEGSFCLLCDHGTQLHARSQTWRTPKIHKEGDCPPGWPD